MPPSRFPGPPAASGAALTVLTGTAACATGAAVAPDHATGTDNFPPIEPAVPTDPATCAPPPSAPPSAGSALGIAAAGAAAPPSAPALLAIWVPKLPIPTLKYGRPSVL